MQLKHKSIAVAITLTLISLFSIDIARADTFTLNTGMPGPGNIAAFGESNTATYGQTFTAVAGTTQLNRFTLYLRQTTAQAVTFAGYVYAWDGTKAVGPQLFASGAQQTSGVGQTDGYNFNAGGINLVAGQQYVAFLSASGFFDGVQSLANMPGVGNTYSDGDFVFYNNGNNFSLLTNTAWSCTGCGYGDVAFQAEFSGPGAEAPEPATLALFGTGLSAVAGVARRRRTRKVASRVS